MANKPKVLDWHRVAGNEIYDTYPPKVIWDVREDFIEIIAAHDPHTETVYVPMHDDIHMAIEDALKAEVARLRKALEEIERQGCEAVDTCQDRECRLAFIARHALEGKDDTATGD